MTEELPKIIGWLLFVFGAELLVIYVFGAPWLNAIAGACLLGIGWWVSHFGKREPGCWGNVGGPF